MAASYPSRKEEFNAGFRAILPLLIGSIPFAIIFGAMAVTSGLSPLAAAAMSAIVFAGSAQFVAAGMVAAGANIWVIIFTTLIVNLRHVLYAATLAPHLKHLSQRWLLPLGFSLTDESFVVSIQRYNRDDGSPLKHWYHLGTTLSMYVNWQVFTWVGLWAGRAIPNPAAWGLDFAFPATFIGMLVPLIVNRSIVACVLCSGIAAVIFHGLPNKLGLIVAALCGVAAGIIVERLFPAPEQPSTPETAASSPDQAVQPAYQRTNEP
jgi:4-azaleucine resistance transporter AzlC